MNTRFARPIARPIASAVAAVLLLGACGDDDDEAETTTTEADGGPMTLARGQDVNFAGGPPGLSDQTMEIDAVEEDGEVGGELRLDPSGIEVGFECADTETEGRVIVGGKVTSSDDPDTAVESWLSVVIKVGEPDGVVLWFGAPGDYASCDELIDDSKTTFTDEIPFADVADGDDIETG
jgi:hypothetical protein